MEKQNYESYLPNLVGQHGLAQSFPKKIKANYFINKQK